MYSKKQFLEQFKRKILISCMFCICGLACLLSKSFLQSPTAPTQHLETSGQIQGLVHTTSEDDSAVTLSWVCCHLKVSYIRGIKKV